MHQATGTFGGIFVGAEDVVARCARDFEITDRALLNAEDGMIDQRVGARHFDAELHNGCAPRRHQRSLDAVSGRINQTAFAPDFVKDLSDQVKR